MAPKPHSSKPTHTKLPRLPTSQKISKRPLLHPPIASHRTGSSTEKVIYLSASSPFIATIKRVRTYLSAIEIRAAGPIPLHSNHRTLRAAIEKGVDAARTSTGRNGKGGEGGEEVILKATGKAIEKLLRVALYFEKEEGVGVRLRTGSVGAIDDVLDQEGAEEGSRVRRTSCLEVGVRLT